MAPPSKTPRLAMLRWVFNERLWYQNFAYRVVLRKVLNNFYLQVKLVTPFVVNLCNCESQMGS